MSTPNETAGLEEELRDRLHTRRLDRLTAAFSGACISRAQCYSIDRDQRIFVKTNGTLNARAMFDGELESLKQIEATKTIRVPKPHTVIHNYDGKLNSAIVIEFLDISPLTSECAKQLAKCLANLHDYNNKVLKFNRRASRWIGGKPPSVKGMLTNKANRKQQVEPPEGSSADGSNEEEEEEEKEENQFAKHSMRIKSHNQQDHGRRESSTPTRGQATGKSTNTGQGSSNLTDVGPAVERFVPQANTEAIEQFGFNVPTSCGSIPQVNEWTKDWVSFYARHRLDKAIRSLLSDHGDRQLNEEWSHLQLKVNRFFSDYDLKGDDKIIPALLHGDLWSGNAAQLNDGSSGVIYDPSSFYGHSEYEFGIVRMFGGFPNDFERTYFETTMAPRRKLFEKRNKLYQLFHHLNHWDHFGSGYRASSLRLMKDLNAAV